MFYKGLQRRSRFIIESQRVSMQTTAIAFLIQISLKPNLNLYELYDLFVPIVLTFKLREFQFNFNKKIFYLTLRTKANIHTEKIMVLTFKLKSASLPMDLR